MVFGVCAVTTLALWAWNRWVRAGRTGQSWGKKVVGLTLQRDVTCDPIGIWMAFAGLAHYVDGDLDIGLPAAAVGRQAADVLGQARRSRSSSGTSVRSASA